MNKLFAFGDELLKIADQRTSRISFAPSESPPQVRPGMTPMQTYGYNMRKQQANKMKVLKGIASRPGTPSFAPPPARHSAPIAGTSPKTTTNFSARNPLKLGRGGRGGVASRAMNIR